MSIRFAWNRQEAERNRKEHAGVTFEEAATVFRDPLALVFDDDEHSDAEHRELIIGFSRRNRLLIISFTERADVIRIISASKADGDERSDYEQAERANYDKRTRHLEASLRIRL